MIWQYEASQTSQLHKKQMMECYYEGLACEERTKERSSRLLYNLVDIFKLVDILPLLIVTFKSRKVA